MSLDTLNRKYCYCIYGCRKRCLLLICCRRWLKREKRAKLRFCFCIIYKLCNKMLYTAFARKPSLSGSSRNGWFPNNFWFFWIAFSMSISLISCSVVRTSYGSRKRILLTGLASGHIFLVRMEVLNNTESFFCSHQ